MKSFKRLAALVLTGVLVGVQLSDASAAVSPGNPATVSWNGIVQEETAKTPEESGPAAQETPESLYTDGLSGGDAGNGLGGNQSNGGVSEGDAGENSPIKGLARFFSELFGRNTVSSIAESGWVNGKKYKYVYPDGERPGYLDYLRVTLQNQQGGYKKGEPKQPAALHFEMLVSNGFMEAAMEKFQTEPDFPVPTGSMEEWSAAIDDWLLRPERADRPELLFTYELPAELGPGGPGDAGEVMKENTVYEIYSEDPGEAHPLGTCRIVASTDNPGSYRLEIQLSSVLYNRSDAALGVGCNLMADCAALADDEEKELQFQDGRVVFEQAVSAGPGGAGGENETYYAVEKSAPLKVDTPYIDYTIELTGLEKAGVLQSLSGMVLADTLPLYDGSPLEVLSVSVDGAEYTRDGADGQSYTVAGGKLRIPLPVKTGEEAAGYTRAVARVRLALSAAQYQSVLNGSGSISQSFRNRAVLEDTGGREISLPGETSTNMSWSFLSKNGKQDPIDGTRFSWNVEVNTRMAGTGNAYLIDRINWSEHKYLIDGGHPLRITVDGDSSASYSYTDGTAMDRTDEINALTGGAGYHTHTHINALTGGAGYHFEQYESGTDKINALQEWLAQSGSAGAEPFYYHYTVTSGGVSAEEAVLVIPYKLSGQSLDMTNARVRVDYHTEINFEGKNREDYLQGNLRVDLLNDVKFISDEYFYGPGPGFHLNEVTINKGVEAAPGYVEKSAATYDEKKHIVKWKFAVNRYGGTMQALEITDELHSAGMSLVPGTVTFREIELPDKNIGPILSMPAAPGAGPYYAYEEASGKLDFKLGDVDAHTSYEIWFDAAVEDERLFNASTGSDTAPLRNRAAYTMKGSTGAPVTKDIDAAQPAKTVWLKKQAVGAFDYTSRSFTWTVTVNPYFYTLEEAKLTDTVGSLPLSDGSAVPFTYGRLLSVTKETADGAVHVRTADAVTSSPGEDTVTVDGTTVKIDKTISSVPVITFDTGGNTSISDKYTFTYTTEISAENLKKWMKSRDPSADTDKGTERNTVTLTGTLKNRLDLSAGGLTATDNAENVLLPDFLNKSGRYNDDGATITWTVPVNPQGVSLAGMTLEEDLTSSLAPGATLNHEVIRDTVRVYQASVSPDGTLTRETELTQFQSAIIYKEASAAGTNGMTLGTCYGFAVPLTVAVAGVPEGTPLIVTFDTAMTRDAVTPRSIRNIIRVKDGGGDYQQSGSADGGSDAQSDLRKYARAVRNPILQVYKHSVNSEKLPLAGAEFTLSEMTVGSDGKYAAGTAVKKAVSQRSGYLYLMNLKKNTVYEVKETKAPAGYELAEPQYVVFDESSGFTDGQSITVQDTPGSEKTVALKVIQKNAEGLYEGPSLDFADDTVQGGGVNNVEFTKQEPFVDTAAGTETDSYRPLAGATFRLRRLTAENGAVDDSWGNQEDSSGKKYMEAVSGPDGKTVFENVDAGYYIITETNPGAGKGYLQSGGQMKLEVVSAETAPGSGSFQYTYTVSEAAGAAGQKLKVEQQADGSYTVKDRYTTAALTLRKESKGAGGAGAPFDGDRIGGVKFTLTGTDYEGNAVSISGVTGADSGSLGEITLSNIPVSQAGTVYTLTEEGSAALPGYDTTAAYTFRVQKKADGSGVEIADFKVKTSAPGVPAVGAGLTPAADIYTITNSPYTGTFTLTKKLVSALSGLDGSPVGNVTFKLYAVKQSGTETLIGTAVSTPGAAGGEVIFTGVPFGQDYLLKEIVPVGLRAENVVTGQNVYGDGIKEVPVARIKPARAGSPGWTYTAGDGTFSYVAPEGEALINRLTEGSLELHKKDQDGNALPGRVFRIYRRSAAELSPDGSGMVIDAPDSVKTYYPYAPVSDTVSGTGEAGAKATDADGVLALEGLPFGDYFLTEELEGDVQAGSFCELRISVSNAGVKAWKRTGTPHTAEPGGFYTLADTPATDSGWEQTPLTQAVGVWSGTVENKIRFGYLDLVKTEAEELVNAAGEHSTAPAGGPERKLSGAEFEIYRAVQNTDGSYSRTSDTPYLTLVTDAEGKFAPVIDTGSPDFGAYRDKDGTTCKRLLYGSYLIKETKAPAGFALDGGEYGFTITEQDAAVKITNLAGEASAAGNRFGDRRLRAAVDLYKTDADSAAAVDLKGAVFEIWTKGIGAAGSSGTVGSVLAATLRFDETQTSESSAAGGFRYVLSDKDTAGKPISAADDQGRSLLYHNGAEWTLLPGEYLVKEIVPPAGYEAAEDFAFTVGLNGAGDRAVLTGVTGNSAAGVRPGSDCSMTLSDQAIIIKLRKRDAESHTELAGSRFRVTGRFSDAPSRPDAVKEFGSDAGLVQITGVVAGERYRLEEITPPEGYRRETASVEFQVNSRGEAALDESCSAIAHTEDGAKDTIVYYNTRTELGFLKKDGDGNPIEPSRGAAEFTVTGRFAGSSAGAVEQIQVTADGNGAEALKGKLVGGETYKLEETAVPAGFRRMPAFHFTLTAEGRVEGASGTEGLPVDVSYDGGRYLMTVTNHPADLTLCKKGTDSQGKEIPLAGTRFLLKAEAGAALADGRSEAVLTTGRDGCVPIKGLLKAGVTYELLEQKACEGYSTPSAGLKFTVTDDGHGVRVLDNGLDTHVLSGPDTAISTAPGSTLPGLLEGGELTIVNHKTEFEVYKQDDAPDKKPVAGAKLALYAYDPAMRETSRSPVRELISGEDALSVEYLPEGTYVLRETERPKGYKKAADIYFTLGKDKVLTQITKDGRPDIGAGDIARVRDGLYRITMTDEVVKGNLTVTKYCGTGADGGPGSEVANLAFVLYDERDAAYGEYVTDAEGGIRLENLPEGVYTLKENLEKSLEKGLDPHVYVDEAAQWQIRIGVSREDSSTVELYWQGEKLTVPEDGSAPTAVITDERMNAAAECMKLDRVDLTGIGNTQFTLEYREEESGTWRPWNSAVGIYRTDVDGRLYVDGLVRGWYRLTETAAHEAYLLDENPFRATFQVQNSNHGETIVINRENAAAGNAYSMKTENDGLLTERGLGNERRTGTLTLLKSDEEGNGLNGVVYTLYKRNISGSPLVDCWNFLTGRGYSAVDDLTGAELEEAGRLTVSGLEWGSYYLAETKTLPGYRLDPHKYEFEIGRSGTEFIFEYTNEGLVNIRNSFTVAKTDREGNYLDGAEFAIFTASGETVVWEGTVNGTRTFQGLLTGGEEYLLRETKAPEGYTLAEDTRFTMSETGELILNGQPAEDHVLTVQDEAIQVTLKKSSSSNQDYRLEGAEYLLTDVTGEAEGTGTGGPEAVVTLTCEPEGVVIPGLLQGHTYTLEEIKAPQGYILPGADGILTFTVTEDGKAVFEENRIFGGAGTDTITALNDPVRLKVTKNSPEGVHLQGCVFRVSGVFAPLPEGAAEPESGAKASVTEAQESAKASGAAVQENAKASVTEAQESVKASVTAVQESAKAAGAAAAAGNAITAGGAELICAATGAVRSGGRAGGRAGEPVINGGADQSPAEYLIVDDEHQDILEGRLIVGNTYTVQELYAPDGYKVGGAVKFAVKEDGSIAMTDTHEYTLNENGEIVMVDQPYILHIRKTDMGGTVLAGAEFTLEGNFADGTRIHNILPDETGYEFPAMMSGGEDYILTETKAPAGYLLPEGSLTIHVEFDGSMSIAAGNERKLAKLEELDGISRLTIQNEKREESSGNGGSDKDKPAPEQDSALKNGAVNTGDGAMLLPALGCLLLGVGMVLLTRGRKRQ